ncbi:MAG TPA: outer membrane lipoprotein-sorting protein [Phycisphaerae bacterium]|nr:outer membrane lipoprotein-sorting protein [Phycisphaerae bacterium]HNU46360.1 outer membrane lipoprotein-sorting protein [Phycisphaerae bacterium]
MMKVRNMAVAAAMLVVGVTAVPAVADEVTDVTNKIIEAWEKHTSISGKIHSVSRTGSGPLATHSENQGTYEVLRRDGKLLYRLEMASTMRVGKPDQMPHEGESPAEEPQVIAQKTLMIIDGTNTYTLTDSNGEVSAGKGRLRPERSPDPRTLFASVIPKSDLKLLPEETVDGQPVWVIEVKPKPEEAHRFARIVYYFRHDGIQVKEVVYGGEGETARTMTVTDIKVDAEIDPKRFVFEAPPGVEVKDMTNFGKP